MNVQPSRPNAKPHVERPNVSRDTRLDIDSQIQTRQRQGQPAVLGLLTGAGTYVAASMWLSYSPGLLVTACLVMLAGVASAGRLRPTAAVAAVGVGVAIGGIAVTLGRTEAFDAQNALLSLSMALSAAVGAGLLAWNAFNSSPILGQKAPDPLSVSDIPAAWAEFDRHLARWQGPALAVGMALLAFGEGAGFGGGALVTLFLLLRLRCCGWQYVKNLASVRWVLVGLGILIVAGCAAWVIGGRGPLRLRELGIYGPWVVAPAVALTAAQTTALWRTRAIDALLFTFTLSAGFALVQYFGNVGPEAPILWPFSAVSAQHQLWVPGTSDRMVAGGFYMHRLKLAHALLVVIGLVLGRLFYDGRMGRLRTFMHGFLLALFGLALLFTYARAAWLAAAAAMCVAALAAPLRVRRWGSLAAVALAVGALSLPAVRERLLSSLDAQTSMERALIWSQGVGILAKHPFGAGLGNYTPLAEARYAAAGAAEVVPRTYGHSLVLSTWAESGPLGLFGYVLMWMALAQACAAMLRTAPEANADEGRDTRQAAAVAGLFALTALWVVGYTHDVFYHKPVALVTAAVLGWIAGVFMGWASHRDGAPGPQRSRHAPILKKVCDINPQP